jgi:hypothetical protein
MRKPQAFVYGAFPVTRSVALLHPDSAAMMGGTVFVTSRRAAFNSGRPMSALERIADSSRTSRHVRFVPKGDIVMSDAVLI